MTSLLDFIIPFFIAFLMALSGYMVALVGDWIKKSNNYTLIIYVII